ncbi:MAG: hypothetical protein RLY97_1404 [Pseudomonadota bacterium]|jgi:hypothetical protein
MAALYCSPAQAGVSGVSVYLHQAPAFAGEQVGDASKQNSWNYL